MRRSKVCFKCNAEKPVSEFYRHPRMGDGFLGKCKECAKKDVAKHRLENIDRIRAYDRERGKLQHRKALTEKCNKAFRTPRITRAHNMVTRAVKKGDLRKEPCVRCGSEKSLAHHESYDYPLNVTWLCQPCHKQRHAEMRREGIIP